MKKLLSILGAIILIGTANTNVIACGGEGNPNPPKLKEFKKIKETWSIWSSTSYNNKNYFGANAGYVYVNSENNMKNFTEITTTINDRIYSLATDKDGNVYAGTEDGTIYRKENNQDNFLLLKNFNNTNLNIWSIGIDSNNNVYAAVDDCIYKKENNSNDWQLLKIEDSDNEYFEIKSFTFDNYNNIYAGAENGTVYKSNGTETFTAMKGIEYGVIYSLIFDSKKNIIYAGTKIADGIGGLYKSTDGSTFKKIAETIGEIHSLTINSKGEVFIGTKLSKAKGTVYMYNNSKKILEIKGIDGEVFTLTRSNNDNIYAGTWNYYDGSIYKFL